MAMRSRSEILTDYVRYGVLQANNVFSGPGLITDNPPQVMSLAGKYR